MVKSTSESFPQEPFMPSETSPVFELIEANKAALLDVLKDYIRIPSVSTDPAYATDVRRCAEFLLARMEEAGLTGRLIESSSVGLSGHPLVYAERIVDEALPTVLFYGHYDVQPPDPLEEWRSPPFEPTVEGDLLVARGATDDKGQSYTHVAAVAAIIESRGELPVNVKFLVEGEEESGGETIEAFVAADAGELLSCDVVVISDSSMFAPGQPSVLYGLKGMLYTEVTVRGPNRDLHSGSFGGAVQNPANAISSIVAGLRDTSTGEITIPGFLDDVRALEDWEREGFAELPFDEAEYAEAIGVSETFGETGYTTLERAWARPTCDVNGMWSGYQGAGAKTIIPGFAGAKISMRLVPDQDPEKIASAFEARVRELAPNGVQVEVEVLHSGSPVLVELEGRVVEAGLEALEEVWGAPPVKVREGGSIPIVSAFAEALEVPVLLMGFGLSDDRLHSPNEKFNISHFYNGIKTIAAYLDRLAPE